MATKTGQSTATARQRVPGAHLGLPQIVPADWSDLDGVSDVNTKALASAGWVYGRLGYRIAVADDALAYSGGLYKDIAASLANVNDELALVASFGWRRTNFNGDATSADFVAHFSVFNRSVGGIATGAGGGNIYAVSNEEASVLALITGALSAPARPVNLQRHSNTAVVAMSAKRLAGDTVEVDVWIGPEMGELYYINTTRTLTLTTSCFAAFAMHVNNNGHDGEMVVYGYEEMPVADLTSRFGLTRP